MLLYKNWLFLTSYRFPARYNAAHWPSPPASFFSSPIAVSTSCSNRWSTCEATVDVMDQWSKYSLLVDVFCCFLYAYLFSPLSGRLVLELLSFDQAQHLADPPRSGQRAMSPEELPSDALRDFGEEHLVVGYGSKPYPVPFGDAKAILCLRWTILWLCLL